MDFHSQPHRRYNPLTGDWVKVSPQRTSRPWQGAQETAAGDNRPAHDPGCYLCPGNQRAGGARNPDYALTHVFVNDYPAILPDTPSQSFSDGLFRAKSERGLCKVICFSPRHDLNLARLPVTQIRQVVATWTAEYAALGQLDFINHVQIFENHGSAMGCSNPHPHGQIWAEECLPLYAESEDRKQSDYLIAHSSVLLHDYLKAELAKNDRIVCQNEGFAAVVPFWAVWPYEVLVLPKVQAKSLLEFSSSAAGDLARILKAVTTRYDNLFKTDFPYSMGIHQSPVNGKENAHWTFHVHFYPPLLRSESIKKFMVGYEMMAMPQRDITAEEASSTLASLSETHYLEDR